MTKYQRQNQQNSQRPFRHTKFIETLDNCILVCLLIFCFYLVWDAPTVVQWWKATVFKSN